ncbi:unnamed protein product [Calypogeia fissa]
MDIVEALSGGGAGGFWLFAVPMLAKQGRSSLTESDESLLGGCMIYLALGLVSALITLLFWAGPGGSAWALFRGKKPIPGPRGLPVIGSLTSMGGQAHRRLAQLAEEYCARPLMALSMGSTRYVVASTPASAREILHSSAFSDRPIKQSAQQLLFSRAIGFAPQGEYWRNLRRIAANHLFSPKRIAAHEAARQDECSRMIDSISSFANGGVKVRPFLQHAALNNVMGSVFGRRYDFGHSEEAAELQAMVREGFEVLGAFNWADHLPILQGLDPQNIHGRCAELVPKVVAYVQNIIEEHREKRASLAGEAASMDFVDVLLGMEGTDKLSDADMISVLWEMIFRGTDTTAILTEWVLAELVLNPDIQKKVRAEVEDIVNRGFEIADAHIAGLPYLQAVIKETLRLHPPGPLLSWARLSTQDVCVAGYHVPKGTTAMVNMHAITHDASVWENPLEFLPQRFVASEGGVDFDVKGSDSRLAPFGAGRRVCPGRALGMSTVQLWVARLVYEFEWSALDSHPVDLTEVLKLSAEMVRPLTVQPSKRVGRV